MGWSFEWASSLESEFNCDFDASYKDPGVSRNRWNFQIVEAEMDDTHGVSLLVKHQGEIYHTYSCYARSLELMMVHAVQNTS